MVHDVADSVKWMINERLGARFVPGQKYIICIQGISTSGKSTMAEIIYDSLAEAGLRTYLLPLDSFYNHADGAIEDIFEYDFDNPAALNWDNVFSVVESISSNAPLIPRYARTKRGSELVEHLPNFRPEVLIIEGVNAFNVVEEETLNIGELDPLDSEKAVENEYIRNSLDLSPFRIIKVHLTLCRSKACSIRIERDKLLRSLAAEDVVRRFSSHVWPATERWGWFWSGAGSINLVHGMFNSKKSAVVMEELVRFFSGRAKLKPFDGHDMSGAFSAPCSGECIPPKSCGLVLEDSN
jgi:uridine kinase